MEMESFLNKEDISQTGPIKILQFYGYPSCIIHIDPFVSVFSKSVQKVTLQMYGYLQ